MVAADRCDLDAFIPDEMDHSVAALTPVTVTHIARASFSTSRSNGDLHEFGQSARRGLPEGLPIATICIDADGGAQLEQPAADLCIGITSHRLAVDRALAAVDVAHDKMKQVQVSVARRHSTARSK